MDDFHDRQLDQFTLVLTLNTVDGERAKQLLDANPTFDRVQLLRTAARTKSFQTITHLVDSGVSQDWMFSAVIDALDARYDDFEKSVKHLMDAQVMSDELLYLVLRNAVLNFPTPQTVLEFVMEKCDTSVLDSIWESLLVDGKLSFKSSPAITYLHSSIQSRHNKKALEEQVVVNEGRREKGLKM